MPKKLTARSLTVQKDHNKVVTSIVADGLSCPETVPLLCSELSRCCGHNFRCVEHTNKYCVLTPTESVVVKNSREMHDFLTHQLNGTVERVYIKRDVLAHHKLMLLNALENAKALTQRVKEKKGYSAIINYISLNLNGWNGICDCDNCDNPVTKQEVIENISLECSVCRSKR